MQNGKESELIQEKQSKVARQINVFESKIDYDL